MTSDRARDNENARSPNALRRRFDALRATLLRAHSIPPDNAALSSVELISSYPLLNIVLNPVSCFNIRASLDSLW